MSPTIDLNVDGPTEHDWAAVTAGLPTFVWPDVRRVVVVSPHPDDETLGAGGLVCTALERGLRVLIVSVTDGEAALPQDDLAIIRRVELRRALACLDPTESIRTLSFGLSDSRVARSVGPLTDALTRLIDHDDLVVCPLADDGHPDHEATALAATDAAAERAAPVRRFPLWAWHCHDPAESTVRRGERLPLTPEILERKRRASSCHVSQLEGPDPIVPAAMLTRLLRPFEVFVSPA